MTLGNPSPRIRASTFKDFFDSEEGNEAVAFANEFVIFNHMARARYSRVMRELIHEIRKQRSAFEKLFPDEGERLIMKRIFEIEVISSTFMSSEELGAFCIAFKGHLEDLPKVLVGYKTSEIIQFYRDIVRASDEYFKDLWIFPDPASLLGIKDFERKSIETIQGQNIEFTRKLFNEIVRFRHLYSTLYNKYKHSFPLFLRWARPTKLNSGWKDDEECLELAVVFDDPNYPLRKPAMFILGEHAIERAYSLQTYMAHFLEALIRRRFNWARFGGKRLPPTVVYGENPLDEENWKIYQATVISLLPTPVRSWPIKAKLAQISGDVSEMHQWIHTDIWEEHWFKTEPARFFYSM